MNDQHAVSHQSDEARRSLADKLGFLLAKAWLRDKMSENHTSLVKHATVVESVIKPQRTEKMI